MQMASASAKAAALHGSESEGAQKEKLTLSAVYTSRRIGLCKEGREHCAQHMVTCMSHCDHLNGRASKPLEPERLCLGLIPTTAIHLASQRSI